MRAGPPQGEDCQRRVVHVGCGEHRGHFLGLLSCLKKGGKKNWEEIPISSKRRQRPTSVHHGISMNGELLSQGWACSASKFKAP